MMTRHRWLIAMAATVVVALGVYALMWIGWVQNWAWLSRVDDAALDPAYRYGATRPGWVMGWDIFCTLLGPGAFRIVTAVIIVVLFVRRHIRPAIFLIVTIELSGLVTEVAKHLADRARPDTALVSAWGLSFPSGHAVGVMVAVLALLTVALPAVAERWRGWLIALGVLVVVMIGIGRVVLNVHHPSDIVAGWALGYAYYVVCLTLVRPRAAVTPRDETPAALDTAR